jgi:hypothetical protein
MTVILVAYAQTYISVKEHLNSGKCWMCRQIKPRVSILCVKWASLVQGRQLVLISFLPSPLYSNLPGLSKND